MTAEERETLFPLLLSDGTFETESFWHAEKDSLFAFYNGGDAVRHFTAGVPEAGVCLLYGTAELTASDGVLTMDVPPHSLLLLAENDGTKRGFLKDGILHLNPVEGGVVHCEEGTFAAQYTTSGGVPELTYLYINGDTLLDGEEEVRFFRWENMRPQS